ncbi:MAG: hypothetical protein DK305_000279 [Chloroflexi bacterium]|jgi:hypothetical protein|nr:MAG: hypothetical protein DK305_000279 [Chloroflexota bacterium]|tara:strand:- start:437 stop:679 length:243 start_codon:yes stop_codon:yes gene_type:complete
MKKNIKKILINQLQDDKDPRFNIWLLLPGICIAILWSLWKTIIIQGSISLDFFSILIWPGFAIFFITSIFAILGWQLDID